MLTEEMKQTRHYKLYATEFCLDVTITQSQPIESTQGAIRTPRAPRMPNLAEKQGESRDEESDADKFVDAILNSQEDPDTRIEPESHKESPEVEKSADLMTIDKEVEEESAKDALIRKKGRVQRRLRIQPLPQPLDPLGLIPILYL
nr:hypothetical protein [Tanacetum cinerariifolium]